MSGRSVAIRLNFGAQITSGVVIANPEERKSVHANAIWDTGTGISLISKNIAKRLELHSRAVFDIHGAFGASKGNLAGALAQLSIGGCLIPLVCCIVDPSEIPGDGYDVLIGLPFIAQGDLLLTHHGGLPMAQFVFPPLIDIDAKEEAIRAGRSPSSDVFPENP